MQIRLAKNSDINALVKLDSETNLTPWSAADYVASLANRQQFILVMEEHGKILACVVYAKVLDEAEILQFWVRKDVKRQGIGRYLLKYLLSELKNKHQIKQVFLEVRDGNNEAINLYQSMGFSTVGRRNNYYKVEQWQFDALVMLKQLYSN